MQSLYLEQHRRDTVWIFQQFKFKGIVKVWSIDNRRGSGWILGQDKIPSLREDRLQMLTITTFSYFKNKLHHGTGLVMQISGRLQVPI